MLARAEGSVSFEEDRQLDARTVVEHAITQLPAASVQRICVIDEGAANRTLGVPASLAMTALRNLLAMTVLMPFPSRPQRFTDDGA